MWIGVMWVSRRNQCFVGCRVHFNHDPRSINLGKFSISWVTSSFPQRCTVATKSKVLKSGVTEVCQLLHSSPQRFRTLPFPAVLHTHVTTPQTVKQSSTKYGIQEIPQNMPAPFQCPFRSKGSRDIAVAIVIRLRSGESRSSRLFPGRGKEFLASPKYPDQLLEPK